MRLQRRHFFTDIFLVKATAASHGTNTVVKLIRGWVNNKTLFGQKIISKTGSYMVFLNDLCGKKKYDFFDSGCGMIVWFVAI